MMLVSSISTQCVSQCRLVCILDGNTTMRPSTLHHAKSKQASLQTKENMILFRFQRSQPACKIETNVTTGWRKKDKFDANRVCNRCNTVWIYGLLISLLLLSRSFAAFNWCRIWERQDEVAARVDARLHKTKSISQWWEVGVSVVESSQNWCIHHKVRPEKFPYKRPLNEDRLMQKTNDRRLFRYVQCDIGFPQRLRRYLSNFSPLFKNTVVSTENSSKVMKENAENENFKVQPTNAYRKFSLN